MEAVEQPRAFWSRYYYHISTLVLLILVKCNPLQAPGVLTNLPTGQILGTRAQAAWRGVTALSKMGKMILSWENTGLIESNKEIQTTIFSLLTTSSFDMKSLKCHEHGDDPPCTPGPRVGGQPCLNLSPGHKCTHAFQKHLSLPRIYFCCIFAKTQESNFQGRFSIRLVHSYERIW